MPSPLLSMPDPELPSETPPAGPDLPPDLPEPPPEKGPPDPIGVPSPAPDTIDDPIVQEPIGIPGDPGGDTVPSVPGTIVF